MDERYGAEGAALLKVAIADMRAAECLRDLPLAEVRPLEKSFGPDAGIAFRNGLLVTARPNHKTPPTLPDGSIDWGRVERILIQGIEFAHG